MKSCYIFDIDGTIADCSHRLHHIEKDPKDWRAFFAACGDDAPIIHIIQLAESLAKSGESVVFVSGRSRECEMQTRAWLADVFAYEAPLFMRQAGDHRPDDIVKGELLDQVIAYGWKPIMAFDDRDRVVAMWRARGIPCAQVAPGDF